jgi:hypothetical protein
MISVLASEFASMIRYWVATVRNVSGIADDLPAVARVAL